MLLAMPGMMDDNFRRAAVAMCVHDEHGAMGIDVGHVIEGLSLAELMSGLGIEAPDLGNVPVVRGGPVEQQRGFVLHSLDWGGQDNMTIGAEWALSASLDILKAIGEGRGPSHYIVALGYSGWAGGQLEFEMTADGWFLGGEIPSTLAAIVPARRWDACFAQCGIDSRLIAGNAGLA